MQTKHTIAIRPYNKKELSALYQVDPRTFRRWMKDIDKSFGKTGQIYTVLQVEKIFAALGVPYVIENAADHSWYKG